MRQASVGVNSAVSGSGVNIKSVEYLSVGVPVVSTSRGMGGIDLLVGEDLLVADAPADFADHIVRLLTSDETAHRVATGGHQTAMRILDVRISLATMASALNVIEGVTHYLISVNYCWPQMSEPAVLVPA